MSSDDQSLHMYQNIDNVQLPSEELFKMLGQGEFSCGWESCCKGSFCISQSVQFYSHHLFEPSRSLTWSVFSPWVAEAAGFFCPGKEWDLWSLLPVIHADGNDLGQAVGTEEQPGVVRAALGQVEQGVADGRCGFTGNVRPRHTLGQYRHQIRQNFSGCKVEQRQAVPLLTGAHLPYSSYSPPSRWREWEESVGAHSSHYTHSWLHPCLTSPQFRLSCIHPTLDSL